MVISPSTQVMSGKPCNRLTASSLDRSRTRAIGSWPEAINSLSVCPPVKPVEPVTATRITLS